MIKIEASDRRVVIDLDYKASRKMADMVLQAIYLYAATTDEDRALVRQMSDMVCGRLPLRDIDLSNVTSPSEKTQPLEVSK
jgi:hypothetical protein